MPKQKDKSTTEFGDFQTPLELAVAACQRLFEEGFRPAAVLEPTCGRGSFLVAAAQVFPQAKQIVGCEVNRGYVDVAREELATAGETHRTSVMHTDFFATDWHALLASLSDPLLVIGNPPWVTNSAIGKLDGSNLPHKSNFQGHRGLDAITGKSNFDISEWMILRLVEWLEHRPVTVAMLCKTSVARKVMAQSWRRGVRASASIFRIDAKRYFGAAVDACFFVWNRSDGQNAFVCNQFDSLSSSSPDSQFGYREGRVVSDAALFDLWSHLLGTSPLRWRSGIKHDCGRVVELTSEPGGIRNGLGELVDLETDLLFPMLKGSALARGDTDLGGQMMLVTQRNMQEDPSEIQTSAPKTWAYLQSHAALFERRASSIYKNRPAFSVFGVGEYSFAPWKVAIAGFGKQLEFRCIGPVGEKPVVLDDTSYFLPFATREAAEFVASLLNSKPARQFLTSLIFWDSKRPITVGVLSLLDIRAVAAEFGTEQDFDRFVASEIPNRDTQRQFVFR